MAQNKTNKIEYNLLSIKEKLSQPQLMAGQEEKDFLAKKAELSDVSAEFSEMIKNGKIIIKIEKIIN